MAGTDQVAQKGIAVEMQSGWPAGVLQIVNDETRTTGFHPWFSGGPDDANFYGLAIRNMDNVNRLVRKLAAIDVEGLELDLDPAAGAAHVGGEGALFVVGNQEVLNTRYAQLPEVEPGVREFGVSRYEKPPTARPPCLFLYIGHPGVDLEKLNVPANINITSPTAVAYREEHKDAFKKIDAFIETHTQRQKEALASGKWLSSALDEIQKIKPGMSRAELEKVFRDDGGELRDRRQYAFRDCPHIKVTVYLEAPRAEVGRSEPDWSKDKIDSISKPFLE
jgi:hypothetical protein